MAIDLKSRQVLIDAHVDQDPVLLTGNALPITFQTFLLATSHDHIIIENRVKPEYLRTFLSSKEINIRFPSNFGRLSTLPTSSSC